MVKVLNVRPAPIGAGERTVALIDVELNQHCRLYNIALRQLPDGGFRIIAPKAFGKHSASFHPELAIEISSAAGALFKGHTAHDRTV